MTIDIKIVSIDLESKSGIVKFKSENSLNDIDSYDPVAFPLTADTLTKETFIDAITPQVQNMVLLRDQQETVSNVINPVEVNSWVDFTATKPVIEEIPVPQLEAYEQAVYNVKNSFPIHGMNYINEIIAKGNGKFTGQRMEPMYNRRGCIGILLTHTGTEPVHTAADIEVLRGFDAAIEYLYNIGVPIFGNVNDYYLPIAKTHTENVYGAGTAQVIQGPDLAFIYSQPTFALEKKFKHFKLTQDLVTIDAEGFTYRGKLFQSDALSREKIITTNMAVTMSGALLPSITQWKAADNSFYTFTDVQDWIAFFQAMVTKGATNFLANKAKKAACDNAANTTQLNAITTLG
jgi:hypothetical protein